MFIMDNSGSMGQDYTPDYMSNYDVSVASSQNPWTIDNKWHDSSVVSGERNCKDSNDAPFATGHALCNVGDVPYMTSVMNSQYYNPAIRYLPAVNADGSSKNSQSTPASVLTDGFDKQKRTQLYVSATTLDLTTNYPDRVWCTINNPSAADLIDTTKCKKNSNYLYPDATYKYGRSPNTIDPTRRRQCVGW